MNVGLCLDARFGEHIPPENPDARSLGLPDHPENPGRLGAVEAELGRRGLVARAPRIAARPATRAELERVHTAAHLDALEVTIADRQRGFLDPDTYFSSHTLRVAELAAGAAIECTYAVLDGRVDAAFAFVRPPGHHATADRSMGFCILNNVAAAAAAARTRGVRVAIFDWDVHHGNGTEAIFYEDGDVLYVSMHEWPQYPGTGARIDVGRGAGMGATVNVPVPSGTTASEYLALFRGTVRPAIERFKPGLILVSAGFDAHKEDPLGGLQLEDDTFATLTRELLAIGSGKLVAILEGGYHLPALARSAASVVETLLDCELSSARPAEAYATQSRP